VLDGHAGIFVDLALCEGVRLLRGLGLLLGAVLAD
jgi:hypothetical protein